MPQIGSDDEGNTFTFRKSIYGKSDGGKGARPRPASISAQNYRDNWDLIFAKKKKKENKKNAKSKK